MFGRKRLHTVDIDPVTGLARLPEGYFFEVEVREYHTVIGIGVDKPDPLIRFPVGESIYHYGLAEEDFKSELVRVSIDLAREFDTRPRVDAKTFTGEYPPKRLEG